MEGLEASEVMVVGLRDAGAPVVLILGGVSCGGGSRPLRRV